MSKNIKDDIQLEEILSGYLSVNYKKLKVGVVGAGKIGFLKAKNFIDNNSKVEILSKEFSTEFKTLNKDNVRLINKEYDQSFILDKHLIIIAINDDQMRKKIIEQCERFAKIFVDCTQAKNSIAKIPIQRGTKNFRFALTTKNANPKMSILVSEKIIHILKNYDDFEKFTYEIRCKVRDNPYKKEILDFIINDEFKEIWESGNGEIVLKLFFDNF
ncbi:MAG: NAD(P)-dependent oxidoreductase [Sarcina sp.]